MAAVFWGMNSLCGTLSIVIRKYGFESFDFKFSRLRYLLNWKGWMEFFLFFSWMFENYY